ncbi:AraC family transcriptional regulator [Microvirga sp. CF3016]|uniref:AraC family transcriptional regulator n=1 Tax=Microvirga sp. CF3016 TaxID=3110181 RepID=UPI002E7A3211|nr:AraC family transcriptional regulator [Microvirga sp. CF3016]MEE1612722.1 AraC family transcriptional regulator [Microvirga sp. CF3016]
MSIDLPDDVPQGLQREGLTVRSPAPENSQIIDQVWHSNKLDELENALNSQISPQRFLHFSSGEDADGKLAYQGQGHFGIFQLRIGREINVLLEAEEANNRMAFVRSVSGTGELLLNRKVFSHSADRAVIFPSGLERIVRFAQDTEIKVFMASRVRMAECCAKLLGHDLPGFVDFDIQVDLEGASARSWMRLLSYAEAELADPYAFIRQSPVAWQQFEEHLLTGFLLSHRHAYSQALLAPQAAAVPFYVKRAEAYIEAHFAEPLSLAEIAAQAGVSARSLQSGFQSFRNITPMGFVRSVRLRRAHEALLAADPAITTVTQIVLACGWMHLGEFATAYRRVFGRTPRQTLHKNSRL